MSGEFPKDIPNLANVIMREAATRGPNYDWKHEAEHYQAECDKLRVLLDKIESQGERDAWEHDQLKAEVERLKAVLEIANKFGVAMANDPENKASVVAMTSEAFKLLKEFGEALNALQKDSK